MDTSDFREKVVAMIKLDDDIATANDMLKELRKRKSDLQGEVMQFMQENNVRVCNTSNGKLTLSNSRRSVPPAKDEVNRSVAEKLGVGLEQLESAFEEAKKAKRYVESTVLRRVKARTSGGENDDEDE